MNRIPGMVSFFSRFHEIARFETFVVTIPPDLPGAPSGQYAFVELYCDVPACDCRRVLLQVWQYEKPGVVLATINYGWETLRFCEKWAHSWEDARDIVAAGLDPLNPQGPHAEVFLDIFRDFVRKDPKWSARFRAHYELFKKPTASPARS